MNKQNSGKSPFDLGGFLIKVAIVLFILITVTVYLMGSLFARYVSGDQGQDSARVIYFSQIALTKYGDDNQYIAPGAALEWNAYISFPGSESATYVFVEISGVYSVDGDAVTLFSGGPEWTVADAWTHLGVYDGTLVYYCALEPNVTLTDVALFESDAAMVPETLTAEDLETIDISSAFRASVVQSNGFDSVEAAWQSLETNHG